MNRETKMTTLEECPHCHKPIELSVSAVVSLLALDQEPKGETREDDQSDSGSSR